MLEQRIEAQWPVVKWEKHRLCLAVSGGADSVAMLRAFVAIADRHGLHENLFVAHVNHGLRGAESDSDGSFVRQLAGTFHLDYFETRLDQEELQREVEQLGSWEGAARQLRYGALIKTTEQQSARFLVTAHTADDQLETVLQRLFRGTGLTGLKAISITRPLNESTVLVRPLLSVTRSMILDYLNTMDQTWRTDSSNASPQFTRNRIRHELIPVLREIFPNRWEKSLLRLIRFSSEVEPIIREQVRTFADSISIRPTREGVELEFGSSPTVSEFVLGEFFRWLWDENHWPLGSMGERQWRRLVRFVLEEKISRLELPGPVVVSRTGSILTIKKKFKREF